MRAEDVAELEGDYPLVVLGERIFNAPAPHVVMPNELGAQAATTHLLEAGCRTVAWWAERWTNPCRPLVRCEPRGISAPLRNVE